MNPYLDMHSLVDTSQLHYAGHTCIDMLVWVSGPACLYRERVLLSSQAKLHPQLLETPAALAPKAVTRSLTTCKLREKRSVVIPAASQSSSHCATSESITASSPPAEKEREEESTEHSSDTGSLGRSITGRGCVGCDS